MTFFLRQNIIEDICPLFLGRKSSFFQNDLESHKDTINDSLQGARILVVGGAGSLGVEMVKLLSQYPVTALHVLDINENGLADLARHLRASHSLGSGVEFRALPFGYGGSIGLKFLESQEPYDYVFNFAALKHVRSEKDVYSTLSLLKTNVFDMARFMRVLKKYHPQARVFSVSTDKAANPTNLMGASKRLMEKVLFSSGLQKTFSARFANIAFSRGSLLESFLSRFVNEQVMGVPEKVKRYFITPRESAEICLLTGVASSENIVTFPQMSEEADALEIIEVLKKVLEFFKYKPVFFDDEAEALIDKESLLKEEKWPVVVTKLDTVGEKFCEEFVSRDEDLCHAPFQSLGAVKGSKDDGVFDLINSLEDINTVEQLSKDYVLREILKYIPEFDYVASLKHLDDRI